MKLTIFLENCYGIKRLGLVKKPCVFDFSKHRTYTIYASNGIMKTSFAKTFQDLIEDIDSRDLVRPWKKSVRKIKKDGIDLDKDQVFVIGLHDKRFESEKMSTLLASKKLKDRYDDVYIKINAKKDVLLKELKLLSGLNRGIEEEISRTFTQNSGLFNSLVEPKKKVFDTSVDAFSDISYKTVFDDKVIKCLEVKNLSQKLIKYIKKYNELIKNSYYFKKGVFNYNNATVIAKSLADNGFFDIKHTISLNASKTKKASIIIKTRKELEKIIEDEKTAILTDPVLARIFKEIDDILNKKAELRNFRKYLVDNMKILPELGDMNNFKQKVWISYFKNQKNLYKDFVKEYQDGKNELSEIIKAAKTENTLWKTVVKIFKERFYFPFNEIVIQNQDDVILEKSVPVVVFKFNKESAKGPVVMSKDDIFQVLSSGEKRVLYLLNIIFEVKAREKNKKETLFIIDDIAESFDYKNKYAIIEYLKEVEERPYFYQIILTHNFDFYRTIFYRLLAFGNIKNSLIAYRGKKEIILESIENKGFIDPFKNWRQNLKSNNKCLISLIPFVRNVAQYTEGIKSDNYLLLTSLLHIKPDSNKKTIKELESAYNDVLKYKPKIKLDNPKDKVIDLIFKVAEDVNDEIEQIENNKIENKIILSIAIRLKAEKYIWGQIKDQSAIDKNQTYKLVNRYKKEFSHEIDRIKLLERVNLMTPENIHINSFMYEPIIDMSDKHLGALYKEIKKL